MSFRSPTRLLSASVLALSALLADPIRAQGCPGATVLEGFGSWPYSTDCQFPDGGSTCLGYPGTTFRWSAPWAGSFRISTCGGDGTDTVLAVFSPCGSSGVPVACNDDSCGVETEVGISSAGPNEYRIEVGTFWPNDCVLAGRLTIAPAPATGASFCSGDGGASTCPCGNPGTAGRGCSNSAEANGAILLGSGVSRTGADSFLLSSSGLPNGTALFFQGDARVANGAGAVFGDGLRCVGGHQIRLAVSAIANRAVRHPLPGGTPISVGGLVAAGDVRHYQAWYRDAASFCTSATFNLTNAWTVTWAQ